MVCAHACRYKMHPLQDACGEFENLTVWAELINATGRPMMIENCHWGGDAPYVLDDDTGELWCPYNIYRAGMDIAPNSWPSFMANLKSLTTQLNKQTLLPPGKGNWPHSRPGCWAYFVSAARRPTRLLPRSDPGLPNRIRCRPAMAGRG